MWQNGSARSIAWFPEISHRDEKTADARRIAARLQAGDVIGAGSGSTSYLTLLEIGRRVKDEGLQCKVIPTSREMEIIAGMLGLTTTSLLNDRPHWYYDGADEVDPHGNLIKGRGGAMYREKLLMRAAAKTFIVVDSGKFVQRLGEKFPVPVEVLPESLHFVESEIVKMPGVETTALRMATGKDGPIITENGNFILDVRFSAIDADAESRLKRLTGVLESGLFWGYATEIVGERDGVNAP